MYNIFPNPKFREAADDNWIMVINPFPNNKFKTSKLKNFADENFRFD